MRKQLLALALLGTLSGCYVQPSPYYGGYAPYYGTSVAPGYVDFNLYGGGGYYPYYWNHHIHGGYNNGYWHAQNGHGWGGHGWHAAGAAHGGGGHGGGGGHH